MVEVLFDLDISIDGGGFWSIFCGGGKSIACSEKKPDFIMF